jgi:hypothetical protein
MYTIPWGSMHAYRCKMDMYAMYAIFWLHFLLLVLFLNIVG